jgi:hypothetical protein
MKQRVVGAKAAVVNQKLKPVDNRGVPFPRWHSLNPKNAIVVPASMNPTKY